MSTPKQAKWSNEAHQALCEALMEALLASESSINAHKDLITNPMASKGFPFSFEAIRYVEAS